MNHKLIKRIAAEARKDISYVWGDNNLSGACGISSWHLMSLLHNHKLSANYVGVPGHYWVEINNYVVDITLSQFNDNNNFFKKVNIIKKSLYYNYDEPTFLINARYGSTVLKSVEGAYTNMIAWTCNYLDNKQKNIINFLKLKQKKLYVL